MFCLLMMVFWEGRPIKNVTASHLDTTTTVSLLVGIVVQPCIFTGILYSKPRYISPNLSMWNNDKKIIFSIIFTFIVPQREKDDGLNLQMSHI